MGQEPMVGGFVAVGWGFGLGQQHLLFLIIYQNRPPEGALRGSVNIWNSPLKETGE